jgi:hypothetical protein
VHLPTTPALPGWLTNAINDGLTAARQTPTSQWYGGQFWSAWHAYASWFRDVGGLHLDGDLWDRHTADATRTLAGPSVWWDGLCVVSDHPTVLHVERDGRINRLHCEDGPSIQWPDGWALWHWHGTQVPQSLIEGPAWTWEQVAAEDNQEVRRCAIEKAGWDTFEAQMTVVDSCDDPGNPGQQLVLADPPSQPYGDDVEVRVLLCTNGTVERDGTRRRFGLTVPAELDTALAAAAWTYELSPELYATATVRR